MPESFRYDLLNLFSAISHPTTLEVGWLSAATHSPDAHPVESEGLLPPAIGKSMNPSVIGMQLMTRALTLGVRLVGLCSASMLSSLPLLPQSERLLMPGWQRPMLRLGQSVRFLLVYINARKIIYKHTNIIPM